MYTLTCQAYNYHLDTPINHFFIDSPIFNAYMFDYE